MTGRDELGVFPRAGRRRAFKREAGSSLEIVHERVRRTPEIV